MTARRPRVLPLIPLSPDALLSSYERHLAAARKRPATIRVYTIPPRLFLEWAAENGLPPLQRLRRRDIEGWLASLADRSSHTQRAYAVMLRLFFKWLAEEDEIPSNPMESMRLPSVDETDKDVLAPAEVIDGIARLEKARDFRGVALVALLYDTGMRAGELCSIRREDVDFAVGVIRLRGTETKGRFPRTVPVSPAAIRHIDRYLRRRTDDGPMLFASRTGALSSDSLYDIVTAAFAFTGKRIGPHDLRHTSASHMSAEVGADELQTIFGWKKPEQARHYTRQAHVANAIAAHRRASPLERLGK